MKFRKYSKLFAVLALILIMAMVIGSIAGSFFSIM